MDNVLISWCLKGQGTVALSTTKLEYIALSIAMCKLIWMRQLVEEVAKGFDIDYDQVAKIHSKVFEDNQGAIAMVNWPQATS